MRTLLFIHGIGVRGDAWFSSLGLVAKKAEKFLPGVEVQGCGWGDAFGARLNLKGVVIPDYERSGRPGTLAESADRARWFLLGSDPLLELRITPKEPHLGEIPGLGIFRRISGLSENDAVLAILREWSMAELWPGFIAELRANEEWKNVVGCLTTSAAATCDKMSRAITAAYQLRLRRDAYPGLTGEQRDRLKNAMINPLGGPPLGAIGDWLLGRLTGAAERRRGTLSDATTPAVGDTIRYQSRGGEIRNFIADRAGKSGASVLLAHSLGGVAAVDWLASDEYARQSESSGRKIDYLITAGSQSPYFYELDALVSRRFGDGLPETFPKKWLNFYDRGDFLSYMAAPAFPGRARDVEVDNRQPFPESHSAYWNNDGEVWKAIAEFLGES